MEEYAVNIKSNVTTYLSAELANLGRELGLNLSKVCETTSKSAINKLQGINAQNDSEQQAISEQSISGGRERFETPDSALRRGFIN